MFIRNFCFNFNRMLMQAFQTHLYPLGRLIPHTPFIPDSRVPMFNSAPGRVLYCVHACTLYFTFYYMVTIHCIPTCWRIILYSGPNSQRKTLKIQISYPQKITLLKFWVCFLLGVKIITPSVHIKTECHPFVSQETLRRKYPH